MHLFYLLVGQSCSHSATQVVTIILQVYTKPGPAPQGVTRSELPVRDPYGQTCLVTPVKSGHVQPTLK